MNTFAVMPREPDARTRDGLNEKYESTNVYRINDVTLLVRTKQLAEDVSRALKVTYLGSCSSSTGPMLVTLLVRCGSG